MKLFSWRLRGNGRMQSLHSGGTGIMNQGVEGMEKGDRVSASLVFGFMICKRLYLDSFI